MTGFPSFTIVLLPVVLSELDSLKINHKNQTVRDKAERLIRQIKEYRRRGSLSEGVTIKRDSIILRTIAKEPVMADTLPWLQIDNNDDRLISHFIEVMRHYLHSKVLLITRDINLQNKMEYARLPFLEPPDPNEE